MFYSDYENFRQQKILAISIEDKLRKDNIDPEKTLVFVGNYASGGEGIIYKGETMVRTFFEWDAMSNNIGSNNRIRDFLNLIGYYKYELPTKEQYEEAKIIATRMPVYPEEGYIQEKSDYVIVKLSN